MRSEAGVRAVLEQMEAVMAGEDELAARCEASGEDDHRIGCRRPGNGPLGKSTFAT